jgi:hypothetical protein
MAADVGPDGTLWLAFAGDGLAAAEINRRAGVFDDAEDLGPCPGVLSFDGSVWRRYLRGTCTNDLAVAPDGTVWVTTSGTKLAASVAAVEASPVRAPRLPPDGLYVFDPAMLTDPR